MDSKDKENDQTGPGIRFGADVSNAYSGEVGYDAGPVEYDTELHLENEVEDEDEDLGRMAASHPSTIQRQMVRSFYLGPEKDTLYERNRSNLIVALCLGFVRWRCVVLLVELYYCKS